MNLTLLDAENTNKKIYYARYVSRVAFWRLLNKFFWVMFEKYKEKFENRWYQVSVYKKESKFNIKNFNRGHGVEVVCFLNWNFELGMDKKIILRTLDNSNADTLIDVLKKKSA